ncbi:hypothetical protein TNIN_118761 [Trichonephila inaurata madagascariensis]|uniref:Uncharacterized protein n=1 Tax=Trichonephila inaurata madagascariensis TaxID=2747483 RepID=A0A8X6XLM7_9ARAC|nr:hypothetical protein TNIN_118761 [Trichonephila inaurata madagascariensis]
MAVRAADLRQSAIRSLPLRHLVHGIRDRARIHLPVLASARSRGYLHPLWGRLRHQPHLGDLRLLLQLQVHPPNRTHEGISHLTKVFTLSATVADNADQWNPKRY